MATAKANPNARPYTGNSDGASAGPRAGMNEFIKQVLHHSNNAMWNNGSWGVRDVRSKPGTMSVHATGRAVDLSRNGLRINQRPPIGFGLAPLSMCHPFDPSPYSSLYAEVLIIKMSLN